MPFAPIMKIEPTECYSAEWLRYEARVLLCGVAPLRSTSATLRSGSATKHECYSAEWLRYEARAHRNTEECFHNFPGENLLSSLPL